MSDRTLKDKISKNDKDKDVPSKSSESIANDTFLKRYKIIEKIGEGSYSEVLKCQNRGDGTVVACKRLKHMYRNWSQVNDIAEIATLRTIQKHSNILQMLEIHYDESLGKVSLVFELMDVNLYELIKDRKRLLPESRVRTIMFQLFRALRHLHKLGIFHRDIKPENILIKLKTDQLKLGDLGSVRGLFSRPPYTEYISTRWYRSPECLLTAGHYSYKMDIWAAGCVFYEVLTLRPLFPGSSEIDQISRINTILGPPPMKLLDNFHKQAELERDNYRNQTQLNRRQYIQKVLDGYSSKYVLTNDSKTASTKSIKSSKNNLDFYFTGKEGTGLDKILPGHITREAKEIIKSCLAYDPEQRPTAQRIIQQSYFYELRESYARNPEKVSSKPCITICGEKITDHCDMIDLGTLGDRKSKRYPRGQGQKSSSKDYSKSSNKPLDKKSSSKVEVNNNKLIPSSSNLSGSKVATSKLQSSKDKRSAAAQPSLAKVNKSRSEVDSERSNVKSKVLTSKTRLVLSKNKVHTDDHYRKSSSSESISRPPEMTKKQYSKLKAAQHHQPPGEGDTAKTSASILKVISSTTEKLLRKNGAKVSDESLESYETSKLSKENESYTTVSKKENRRIANALNNNNIPVSPTPLPDETVRKSKFGSKSEDVKDARKAMLPVPSDSPYVKAPSELKFLQKKIKADHRKPANISQASQQQSQQLSSQKVYVGKGQPIPKSESVKVAILPPKVAAAALKYGVSGATTSAAVAKQLREVLGEDPGVAPPPGESRVSFSPAASSYTASSVKIGKLRFRQKKPDILSSPENMQQRSRIPLLVENVDFSRKSYKNSTKLTSPQEKSSRRERLGSTTEKWRNTGIPRVIPMSPERERNIKLIRESLTLDKNKRLRIRQEAISNSQNPAYNYAPPSQIVPQRQTRVGERYSSGRYLNSTTDYENHDVQETSSSTAQLVESRVFNPRTSRIPIPGLVDEVKKPSVKSSDLYPQHVLDIYSSRHRGPDVNMNILKDANYVKHQDRAQQLKEKLNSRIQARRHQNSSAVGDHPSKLNSERNSTYDYGHYSSAGTLLREEESRRFSKNSTRSGGIDRRPPIPSGQVNMNKSQAYYKDPASESMNLVGGPPYQTRAANKSSHIPRTGKTSARNRRGMDQLRKECKQKAPRMGDDVFCSSDDDLVITMRKKFDDLISERARRLTESLKTNPANEAPQESARKLCDSRSELDMPAHLKRSRQDKSKKYARRELRARMAESLIANNCVEWKSRIPDRLLGREGVIENTSNNSGDYLQPYQPQGGGNVRSSELKYKPYPSGGIDMRASMRNEYLHGNNFAPSPRIYPLSSHHQEQRGRIYTPQGTKPVYQSSQLGAVLQERKLRYSHNTPVPISRHSSYSQSQHRRNIKEDLKRRQRI